jgi:FtsH-binding integral membrane protein
MRSGFETRREATWPQTAISGARAEFLARTYSHLFAAIAGFTLFEVFLFRSGLAEGIAGALLGVCWLFVLGGFVVVSWFASRVAARADSRPAQYAALAGFVLAEAIIFVPLLYIANAYAPGAISSAALVTLIGFAGLTAVVFVTRQDFSFLRGIVGYGMVIALVAIVAGAIFGFQLGTWFSVGMVGIAGAAILHDTSHIMKTFPEDRYVAASLQLFASVALMFWYVLRLFMSRD